MIADLKGFWKNIGITIYRRKEDNIRILLLEDRNGNEFGKLTATSDAETYEILFELLLFYTSDLCTGYRKSNAGNSGREFLA